MNINSSDDDVHEFINYMYSTIYDVVVVRNAVIWTTLHSNEIYWAPQSNPSSVKHMKIGMFHLLGS